MTQPKVEDSGETENSRIGVDDRRRILFLSAQGETLLFLDGEGLIHYTLLHYDTSQPSHPIPTHPTVGMPPRKQPKQPATGQEQGVHTRANRAAAKRNGKLNGCATTMSCSCGGLRLRGCRRRRRLHPLRLSRFYRDRSILRCQPLQHPRDLHINDRCRVDRYFHLTPLSPFSVMTLTKVHQSILDL